MTTATPLSRSTPEAQGIPSSAIRDFVEAVERKVDTLHSFMLLRHGRVVAEGWWSPYAADQPHMLFSLSKSFTATAVGLAIAEGHFTLDDPVISFFPDALPTRLGVRWPDVQVRHLLSMSTGHLKDTIERIWGKRHWVKAILAQAVRRAPGTHFVYNNGASYLLAAIVRRTTGENVLDYLQPRLFVPLGIETPTWDTCPLGISCGGWGLSLKTEDIARFGQLYLQKGHWNGAQLLPEAWIETATGVQINNGDDPHNDWAQGYGFQFWRCRHGAYRGDGAFGQYCLVMPAQEAVLVMTGGVADMQPPLNLVWEHLLPAFADAPLPADEAAHTALTAKLGTLALQPQPGAATSAIAAQVSGHTYRFPENAQGLQSLSCDFEGDGGRLTLRDARGAHPLAAGYGAWQRGATTLPAEFETPGPVAVSGAWTDDHTYTLQACFYHTPFCTTLSCRFAGEQVFFNSKDNVGFGPTERPQLVGQNTPKDTPHD